ncbi:MAG: septal ring lytic transglycosylase RlpA family protein [Aestuariivirga sp.]|uniref:septal ring lytic transglycosylase RlpA family protein n=1 Tax=Aestuariivirga sp. TaxID=2650926 RepID=UPI0025BE0E76|nr:septal ring lytic transglycosylase RlpA family protein [Aestuariivirga sp.]MCA3560915.1 septal ring lytic transglycosylase RlpA family protein [Aestuariivirga sp.]
MLRFARNGVVLVIMGLAIAGCASHKHSAKRDPFAGQGSPIYPGKGPVPWGGGRHHVGKPYQVAGEWFTPRDQPGYDKKGTASWYGEAFNRRKTSNGEWFDMNRLTAAHATLPLPSYAKVTNLENGREIVVRINDRGPFVDTRVIDISKAAAAELGYLNQGTARVRVQYLGPAPLNDNGGRHLMAMNTELERGTPARTLIAAAGRRKDKSAAGSAIVAQAKPGKRVAAPAVETVAYQPPPEPEVPAPAEAAPTGDISYFIQLGSFADGGNAARVRDRFSAVWPVQFIELSGAAGPIYRVRLGPISGSEDAQTALSDAQSAGFTDARLIKTEAVQASLQ